MSSAGGFGPDARQFQKFLYKAELLKDWVWSVPNLVHLEQHDNIFYIYLLGHAPRHGVHNHVCGGGWANRRPGL